jgi:hypothetical protein
LLSPFLLLLLLLATRELFIWSGTSAKALEKALQRQREEEENQLDSSNSAFLASSSFFL